MAWFTRRVDYQRKDWTLLSRGIESLWGNENLKIMVQQISHPDDIDEALKVASERLTAFHKD